MSDPSYNPVRDDMSSSDIDTKLSTLDASNSINGSSNANNQSFSISQDTMRILFIIVAIIAALICLCICVCVCIRIYPRRGRKSKREENKDQLLPEQSHVTSDSKSSKPPPSSVHPTTTTNGKQSSSMQQIISNPVKPTTKPFYYDNLDDIPFIDESRPTSVIEIAQV